MSPESPPGRLLVKNNVVSSADMEGAVSVSSVLTGEATIVGADHGAVKFVLSVIQTS